ncbi:hypothetical protein EDD18DRAFT_1405430 [Armillaria luteobubalina]|uniref:Heterokaryon incompatibility domain-containing protein n=1 Tax=Armillaria luteobubalina TaxID=153913 RepID=A0AA39PZR8_9AGAR|nr:hypothetical protein EDD18DRAFT_1405430 [Armillaria luteobubalina]
MSRKIVDIDWSDHDLEDRRRRIHSFEMYLRDEISLSAFTEAGRAESSIEVPKQRSYSGRSPVIPCSLADTPCATLGAQDILDRLNDILRTSYTLPMAPSSSTSIASPVPSSATSVQDQLSLLSILKDCIKKNYDFGTAYALLRPVWNAVNLSSIQDDLRRRNRIVDPELPPRRVWDLCSNCVVPSWITCNNGEYYHPTPISHAWVDEKDRVNVWTPINGKEWPVPLPKDADLNLVRIEILNLAAEDLAEYRTPHDWTQYAAEYAWLDVLCLRQKEEGGPREDLRMEEWRLDVPTIGAVYQNRKVLIYLNGLGRPLRLKDGDLDSDRSWFRHAWTLQEVGMSCIIAGDTPDGPLHAQQIDGGNYETVLLTRFHNELNSLERGGSVAIITHMQKHVSTNPVDRVAGLAFILGPNTLPAYHESETLEDAWTALVNAMIPWNHVQLLLTYPRAGLGSKKWRPTWDQLMQEPLPQFGCSINAMVDVAHNDEIDEDLYFGLCIQKGYVQGFDTGSVGNQDRHGELVVKAADGIMHTFKIHVTHQLPIPEDTYTLLGGNLFLTDQWAIGRQLPNQRFEKVSLIATDIVTEIHKHSCLYEGWGEASLS